jgi:integrase
MRGPQQRPRKPYPATPADVAAFLQANAPPIRVTRRGEFEILKTSVSPTGEPAKRYATLSRYLGTLSKLHSDGNHPDPTRDPEVVAVWRVLRRGLERPQQKASLGWEAIRQALVALPNNLAGKRDRARLLLAYTLMARRSELVALNVENFAIDEEGGATVSFERTKTSERATNYLPAEIMAVVGEWLRAAQIRSGAMFVRLDSAGGLNRERLKPQRVASTSTRVAQRLKLPDFDPES